jgi:hypothetical protein
MHFLIHEDYLTDPENWKRENRWEVSENSGRSLNYRIPSIGQLSKASCSLMSNNLFAQMLEQFNGNSLRAFEEILSKNVPVLAEYYGDEIDAISGKSKISAVFSPINCPSLATVVEKRNIPIIYFEMGPLRSPEYIDLAYFDFQGLNENSEFDKRYDRFLRKFPEFSPSHEGFKLIRQRYLKGDQWSERLDNSSVKFDVGVPLQVEDDTNLLASGRGFNNQMLITYSRLKFPGKRMSYRAHPGSLFEIKIKENACISEENACISGTDFVFSCDSILTINSSLGFESLLWGKKTYILGNSPYSSIASLPDQVERERSLCFYLTNYLVPFESLFSREYMEFRLSNPSEPDIEKANFSGTDHMKLQERYAKLTLENQQLTLKNQQLILELKKVHASHSWRLTSGFRALSSLMRSMCKTRKGLKNAD